MMAGLFAIFTAAFVSIFFRYRKIACCLIVIGLALSLLMLWFHAVDPLKIHW